MKIDLYSSLYKYLDKFILRGNNPQKLVKRRDFVLRLRNALNDKIRFLEHANIPSISRKIGEKNQDMPVSVMLEKPPWASIKLSECTIPGMITEEEARYYLWLGQYYSGLGEVIELGPWLGRSTFYITEGLLCSKEFKNKKLHVFDDFIWRSSFMNAYVQPDQQMSDDDSFLPLFHEMTSSKADFIEASAVGIQRQSWNTHLPLLSWERRSPIEMVFIDCGKAFLENEAWFQILSPSFIKDTTLIIMQDWRAHRKTPRKPFTQIWHFTESKGSSLELIHETKQGDIASFIWRGVKDINRF